MVRCWEMPADPRACAEGPCGPAVLAAIVVVTAVPEAIACGFAASNWRQARFSLVAAPQWCMVVRQLDEEKVRRWRRAGLARPDSERGHRFSVSIPHELNRQVDELARKHRVSKSLDRPRGSGTAARRRHAAVPFSKAINPVHRRESSFGVAASPLAPPVANERSIPAPPSASDGKGHPDTPLVVGEADFARLIAAARDPSPVSGYTHNFYKYPARFSPKFVRAAIEVFTRAGNSVFDPFMGGGTSMVEAMALGRPAFGTDISALAAFVAAAKTTSTTRRSWLRSHAGSTASTAASTCTARPCISPTMRNLAITAISTRPRRGGFARRSSKPSAPPFSCTTPGWRLSRAAPSCAPRNGRSTRARSCRALPIFARRSPTMPG